MVVLGKASLGHNFSEGVGRQSPHADIARGVEGGSPPPYSACAAYAQVVGKLLLLVHLVRVSLSGSALSNVISIVSED